MLLHELRLLSEEWDEEDPFSQIERTHMRGTFYHGSRVGGGAELIHQFEFGYNDWDAIWFSDEEYISEEFATNANDDQIQVVYRVTIDCEDIARMDKEEFADLGDLTGTDDPRDLIEHLKHSGFSGWLTSGSVGYNPYNDYALFDTDCIKVIDGVKMKINDEWTKYMPLEVAARYLQKVLG